MATTKAKIKATPSAPAAAKSARPGTKNGAAARGAPLDGGSRKGVGISPADLPLPTGYVAKVDLPAGYRPGGGDEEYMSAEHLEYFRRKLLLWRQDLIEESQQTIENLRDEVRDVGDEAERATRETENSLELRTRDRYRKLIGKIEGAQADRRRALRFLRRNRRGNRSGAPRGASDRHHVPGCPGTLGTPPAADGRLTRPAALAAGAGKTAQGAGRLARLCFAA